MAHSGWRMGFLVTLATTFLVVALVHLAAAQVNVQIQVGNGGAQAEQPAAKEDQGDLFRPEPVTSNTAENALRQARGIAATEAYAEASQRYDELVAAHPRTVSELSDGLYVPLWRVAIEDVSKWPLEGVRAYQETVNAAAQAAYNEALRRGDLREIERVAQRYFLSDVGDNAAVLLGDRLREAGWPALALYYYALVLEKHQLSDIPRSEVQLRAALAAREGGMEERFTALAAGLKEAAIRPPAGAAEAKVADWLAAQRAQSVVRGDPAGGFGNINPAPGVEPAAPVWEVPLAWRGDAQRGMPLSMLSGAATPPIYPTICGDSLYLCHLYSVWRLDAASGATRWRYDTREEGGEALPPIGAAQARQPTVVGEVVYVPLEKPQASGAELFMFGQRRGAATELYALEAASGRPLWHWDPGQAGLEYGELCVDGQPVVSGDLVLVGLNTVGGFFSEIHIAALDRRSGRLVWAEPITAYQSAFTSVQNAWWTPQDIAGVALAARGGLLLSSAVGVTTAQSMLSGSVLWTRVMTMRRAPAGEQNLIARQRGARQTFSGAVLARQPRLLADRGLVIGGFILSPRLWAYDWLDGRAVWQQEAAAAPQPLAICDDRVVSWGSAIMVLDLKSGQPAFPAAVCAEPVVAEPTVGQDVALVPTASGVTAVSLKTGKIIAKSQLPKGSETGNLLLTEPGLVIVSDGTAACLLDWETAKGRYLGEAAERPTDAGPLVTLGTAALRVERADEGLDYLDQALARNPPDDLRAKAYQLYEEFYRLASARLSHERVMHLLSQLKDSARGGGTNFCRQAFLRAEYLAQHHPEEAVAALQEILDDPAQRLLKVSGAVGPGVSGILAEEAIARLMVAHGSEVYQPWEWAAAAARREARAARSYDKLLEAALRYPNSMAAREALDDALGVALERGEVNEANRLLVRLVNLTPPGERERQYRGLLAETSLRLGLSEFAALEARALERESPPGQLIRQNDGALRSAAALARATAASLPPAAAAAPPARRLARPPYRLAWKLEATSRSQDGLPRMFSALEMSGVVEGLDENTNLLLGMKPGRVVALDRGSGETAWECRLKIDQRYSYQMRCLYGRSGLYVASPGALTLIDPQTGQEKWSIRLEPQRRNQLFAPRESLLGTVCYGDLGWKTGTTAMPMHLSDMGGFLVIGTSSSTHLVDSRDGYTARTVGYPYGVLFGNLPQWEGRVAALPAQPRAARGRILAFDLATGDLAEAISLEQAVIPSPSGPQGGRYWPLFAEGGNQACIFDTQTGRVSPMVELPEAEEPNDIWQRRAVALKNILIMFRYQKPTYAFDVEHEETLWSFDPPERGSAMAYPWGDDRVLITWSGGAAMIKADDGTELWRRTLPNGHVRAADFAALGNNLFVQVYEQRERRQIMYLAWIDAETGNDVFQFRQAEQDRVDVALIDERGVLIKGQQPLRLEYWVSDPNGDWK